LITAYIRLGPDLQNVLRLSYDSAIITIDFFLGMIHLQNCKFFLESIHKLTYDFAKRNDL